MKSLIEVSSRYNCIDVYQKVLRLFLSSPSPSWIDYYLKNIQVYYKKADTPVKPQKKVKRTPFGEFKKTLKDNLKVIKKSQVVVGEKTVLEYDQTMSSTDEVRKVELSHCR